MIRVHDTMPVQSVDRSRKVHTGEGSTLVLDCAEEGVPIANYASHYISTAIALHIVHCTTLQCKHSALIACFVRSLYVLSLCV